MNKAQEFSQLISADYTKLNDWIDTDLKQKFIATRNHKVTFQYDNANLLMCGLKSHEIVSYLESLGFSAKFVCPDIPATKPYYEIIIPPQAS